MGRLYGTMKSQGLRPDQSFEQCARIQMEDLRKVFMMPQQEGQGLLPDAEQFESASINEPQADGVEQPVSGQSDANARELEEDEIQPAP